MSKILFGLAAVLGLGWFLSHDDEESVKAPPKAGPTTSAGKSLVPDVIPSEVTKEGISGSSDVPWAFLEDWVSVLGPDVLGAAPTVAALPPGVMLATYAVGAAAPMTQGERVTFSTERAGVSTGTVYEGSYQGTTNPALESTVIVDRLAQLGDDVLVRGTYVIPASKYTSSHDRLQRVLWTAVEPSDVGLVAFSVSAVPSLEPGDQITVAARDGNFNTAVFIASIASVTGDAIVALLTKPYRTIHEEGSGPVVVPKVQDQARVYLSRSMLVDPASLIPAA